ncbi:ankyrin repeat domain-containing protein 16 isoform X2 [Mustela nigripes]|uniref:ankyrin repeat domain-containing protein 16 isoform X2 n=1 Tax=Mustela nigripes TaxID=77151 RepID=UPI0028154649|nr:ankyrin repeat domain-containing protein 16 isoform X2 [Mustela nigripes]XP_059260000.1 ankyrin repeat domain-containing protein 16 isoform X2 [Mustela nigripes]XP_059260001.1 ankyrin repeat domain-containing protein 16 isoform X2 [Mustela nigripes]XP_059260002.1 ankyrin repeat domain-containing protein 16 isoform X2 [Mustela nigripes]
MPGSGSGSGSGAHEKEEGWRGGSFQGNCVRGSCSIGIGGCGVGGARVSVGTYSRGIYGLFKTASWSQQGCGRRHCLEANGVLTQRGQGGSEGPVVAGRTCWVCGMEAGHSPSRVSVPGTGPEKSPGERSRASAARWASAPSLKGPVDSGVRGSRAPEATSGDTSVPPRPAPFRALSQGGETAERGLRDGPEPGCRDSDAVWYHRVTLGNSSGILRPAVAGETDWTLATSYGCKTSGSGSSGKESRAEKGQETAGAVRGSRGGGVAGGALNKVCGPLGWTLRGQRDQRARPAPPRAGRAGCHQLWPTGSRATRPFGAILPWEATGGCEPRREETRLSWTGTVQNASWGQEPGQRTSRELRGGAAVTSAGPRPCVQGDQQHLPVTRTRNVRETGEVQTGPERTESGITTHRAEEDGQRAGRGGVWECAWTLVGHELHGPAGR